MADESLMSQYHLKLKGMLNDRLSPFSEEKLCAIMSGLESSSGGDFVDALADALARCVTLNWRRNARKLVVVIGDSPGHSLLKPAPKNADACYRVEDVETQLFELHQLGVEMVTLYHPLTQEVANHFRSIKRGYQPMEMAAYAQSQYQRIASQDERAFSADTFAPEEAAKKIADRSFPLARQYGFGVLGVVT